MQMMISTFFGPQTFRFQSGSTACYIALPNLHRLFQRRSTVEGPFALHWSLARLETSRVMGGRLTTAIAVDTGPLSTYVHFA